MNILSLLTATTYQINNLPGLAAADAALSGNQIVTARTYMIVTL
jgi:hypothetical protein